MQLSFVLTAALAALVSAGEYEVSIYASASAYAEAQLSSLSSQCETATGAEATSLSSAYESLKAEASSANAIAVGTATFPVPTGGFPTAPPGYPAATGGYGAPSGGYPGGYGNGTGIATPTGPVQQTDNGAMATAVPVALGAVGMAVMGLL